MAARRTGDDRRDVAGSSGLAERATGSTETVSAPVTATITILAALVGAAVLALGVDALTPGVLAALAGCSLTGAVTATTRRTPGGRALGSALAVAAALGVGAATVLAATGAIDPFRTGVVLSLALVAFGATATATGAVGGGAVRSALPVVVITSVPLPIVAMLATPSLREAVVGRLVGGVGTGFHAVAGRVGAWLFASGDLAAAVASLSAALVCVCWSASVVLPRLALPDLVARDRRRVVRRRLRTSAARAGLLGWALAFIALATVAVDASPRLALPATLESAPIVGAVLAAPSLRWLALASAVALWGLWLASKLPVLGRLRYHGLVRWSPALCGGGLLAAAIALGYPALFYRVLEPRLAAASAEAAVPLPVLGPTPIDSLSPILAPPTGVGIASVAAVWVLGLVGTTLCAVVVAGAFGLLPDRGAPGALVAGALVAGSVLAAGAGGSAIAIVVPVACAIVAWDSALYGVSLTEELGAAVGARGPALAHVTASVLVGAVGVALALGSHALLVGSLVVPAGSAAALLLSLVLALLASLVALKRRAAATVGPVDGGGTHASPPDSVGLSAGDSLERLEDLGGVSPALAARLRASGYDSIESLSAASRAELAAVEGVGPPLAARIVAQLERARSDARGERDGR